MKYILILFSLNSLLGNEWPNFGGPSRNQFSDEEGLKTVWGDEEPKRLWKMNVGIGYSSIIESEGFAYTQGNADGRNTLYCVESATGKVLWQHKYPCAKAPKFFDGGSRSTPTIANGILYLCSHEGDFYALDAKNGSILWTQNLIEDLNGKRPTWGYAGSPLVVKDKIIFETGSENGSLVCLDAKDGKLLWKSGESGAGYASPMLNSSGDIVVFNEFGIMTHDLLSGKIQKKYQHKTRYGINAAQPMLFGEKIFISSAYGKGAA